MVGELKLRSFGIAEGECVVVPTTSHRFPPFGVISVHGLSPEAYSALGDVLGRREHPFEHWGDIHYGGLDHRICSPATFLRSGGGTDRRSESLAKALRAVLPARIALRTTEAEKLVRAAMARFAVADGTLGDLDNDALMRFRLARAWLRGGCVFVEDPDIRRSDSLERLAEDRLVLVRGGDFTHRIVFSESGTRPRTPPWLRWVSWRRIGGMPRPGLTYGIEETVRALREAEVETVVGLEESRPECADALETAGIRYLHFPVEDMTPPPASPALEHARRAVDAAREGRVSVFHCRAGLGRTGTLLGLCLLLQGYSYVQCMALLRDLHPQLVQTASQERLLQEIAATL